MTKAIIVAAGSGNRLKHYTEDLPKCMLPFQGKPILEWQMDAFRANGIKEVFIVKGYAQEKINYPGVKYFYNDDFSNNNILVSLFYAKEAMEGPLLISYSDILFEPSVVESALNSPYDMAVIVDMAWKENYADRKDHPITEAEKVYMDENHRILKIGKKMASPEKAQGEFIGMVKCSADGTKLLAEHYRKAKERYWDKPFQTANSFQKAYLTDMLQELIDQGVDVFARTIQGGWKEIDTVEDYEKALS